MPQPSERNITDDERVSFGDSRVIDGKEYLDTDSLLSLLLPEGKERYIPPVEFVNGLVYRHLLDKFTHFTMRNDLFSNETFQLDTDKLSNLFALFIQARMVSANIFATYGLAGNILPNEESTVPVASDRYKQLIKNPLEILLAQLEAGDTKLQASDVAHALASNTPYSAQDRQFIERYYHDVGNKIGIVMGQLSTLRSYGMRMKENLKSIIINDIKIDLVKIVDIMRSFNLDVRTTQISADFIARPLKGLEMYAEKTNQAREIEPSSFPLIRLHVDSSVEQLPQTVQSQLSLTLLERVIDNVLTNSSKAYDAKLRMEFRALSAQKQQEIIEWLWRQILAEKLKNPALMDWKVLSEIQKLSKKKQGKLTYEEVSSVMSAVEPNNPVPNVDDIYQVSQENTHVSTATLFEMMKGITTPALEVNVRVEGDDLVIIFDDAAGGFPERKLQHNASLITEERNQFLFREAQIIEHDTQWASLAVKGTGVGLFGLSLDLHEHVGGELLAGNRIDPQTQDSIGARIILRIPLQYSTQSE